MNHLPRWVRAGLMIAGVALLVIGFAVLFHANPGLTLALSGLGALGLVNVNSDSLRVLIKEGLLDAAGGPKRNIVAKTANYNINPAVDPSGTLFTNRGAGGAVNFTLPAATPALAGVWYEIDAVAGQNTAFVGTAGQIVTLNNAAATSVTASTAAQLIGAHMIAVCDGTSWHVIGDRIGATYTVA